MNLYSLLTDKKETLTPAQERALRYIFENIEEAVFSTATTLAKRAGVSEATLVRLAQTLGFDGYPRLRDALRQRYQDRFSTVHRLEETSEHIGGQAEILQRVIQQDIENLSKTLQDISPEIFSQVVEDLLSAKRIFIAGFRGSYAPAVLFSLYLRFLKKEVWLLTNTYGEMWDVLYELNEHDLLFAISFPRYTTLTVEVVKYVRSRGVKVIALTDSILSPLGRRADLVVPVRCSLDSYIESFTAAISIFNAILTAMSLKNPKKVLSTLKLRESLWSEQKIYMTPTTA